MSIETFHYILSSVMRLTNVRLLLDEFYKIIWAHPQNSGNQMCSPEIYDNTTSRSANISATNYPIQLNQTAVIHTHLIIFIVSLASYLYSLKSLDKRFCHYKSEDASSSRCNPLIDCTSISLVLYSIYLYLINTLDSSSSAQSSCIYLKCIHTVTLIGIIIGLSVCQLNFQLPSDHSTIGQFAIRKQTSQVCHNKISGIIQNQLVRNSIVGSLTIVFASIILGQLYITFAQYKSSQFMLSYSNVLIILMIVCLTLELFGLIVFEFLKKSLDNDVTEISDLKKQQVEQQITEYWHTKASSLSFDGALNNSCVNYESCRYECCRNCQQKSPHKTRLPDNFLSISEAGIIGANNTPNEVFKTVDKDEYDNSIDLYEIDLYDRSKFSLYEEEIRNEGGNIKTQNCYQIARSTFSTRSDAHSNLSVSNHIDSAIDHLQSKIYTKHRTPSVLDLLKAKEGGSSWLIRTGVMLALVGAVYQANQYCYLADYLLYLLHDAPQQFRQTFIDSLRPILMLGEQVDLDAIDKSDVTLVWLELICLSYLLQNSARFVCLHYLHVHQQSSTTSENILLVSFLLAATVPIQFTANYHLIHSHLSSISIELKVLLASIQLVIIQLQIGLIGSLIDHWIVRMSQNYSIGETMKQTEFKLDRANSYCVMNGFLSNSFYSLGATLMSLLVLIVKLFAT